MLNYIKAELWKASQRLSLAMCTGVLLLLAGAYSVLMSGGSFVNLAASLILTPVTGMLLAPALVQLVDGGGRETVKNELSFGLGRSTVYLGKLFAVLFLGYALCALVLGVCLGGGWVLFAHDDPQDERVLLAALAFALLGALPLWCSAASVCHMAAMNIRSAGVWVTLYYMMFFFGQPILVLLVNLFLDRTFSMEDGSFLQAVLLPYSLTMPQYLSGWLSWEYQRWCWGIGLGWTAGSTFLGMLAFRRQDVR